MKLMKATLMRLWHLTRATSIVVGLAVMVALVGGVVSLGLAKPPAGGEPPPSGGETAASILKGVTNTATAVTTLINSGTGAALNLVVQPGQPPLTVNDGAGTATGLSADKVDGKDADAFVSATNGKAPDSELLDGKDSTEFLGASAKAADSDKLDGKDSTDFMPKTYAVSADIIVPPSSQAAPYSVYQIGCDLKDPQIPGDRADIALSAGWQELELTSRVTMSFGNNGPLWFIGIANNGASNDHAELSALCADNGVPHQQ